MGRTRHILAILSFFLVLVSCGTGYNRNEDIVILYTNDVHCDVGKGIGYAGVVQYKKEMLERTPNVILVDMGDAIQGEPIGTVSEGTCIIDIMNRTGYDFSVLGNHEFDYGMYELQGLIERSKSKYLCCNVRYTGKKFNLLEEVRPYRIVDFDGTKVAFIGVSTPESLFKSNPDAFVEDGEQVYEFVSGQELYDLVQGYVDEVKRAGARYVILLSHLGIDENSAPNRSYDLIRNTMGIDAVLDGHSHSVSENEIILDKTNKSVVCYSQAGSRLANLGKLVITSDGKVSTELITKVEKDPATSVFVEYMQEMYGQELTRAVAKSEVDLTMSRSDGTRAVRNRETALGDFCADAYRYVLDSDIAFVNAGSIRADIKMGDMTVKDMLSVIPYGNYLCKIETTGQKILDALELSARAVTYKASDGNKSMGENAGFLQVSGIKFTIDTSIPSSCVLDEKGYFISVNGKRRVSNVMVESAAGKWSPIDPDGKYTLVSTAYCLKDMNDGYTMFADDKYLLDSAMMDNHIVINYVRDFLLNRIPKEKYGAAQGRITVI